MGAYKRLSTIAYAQSVVWRVGEVAIVAILDKSGGLVELIEKRDQFGLFPTHLTLGAHFHVYTPQRLRWFGLQETKFAHISSVPKSCLLTAPEVPTSNYLSLLRNLRLAE